MTRVAAAALSGVIFSGVGCAGPSGEPRADVAYEESFGEIVDVVSLTDIEFIVSVRTDGETLELHVGLDTYLSVGGVVISGSELREYLGFSAIVLHRQQQAGRREARFIGVEPRPTRKTASAADSIPIGSLLEG